MNVFRTRFAPSPTYFLHLGHALSALHVWRAADQAGGEVLLRIEDIDTTRCRPEYTEAIYEDLEWLGLEWPDPVRVQSEHFDAYAGCVAHLTELGLTYRCFRTRAELAGLETPMRPGPHAPEAEACLLERGQPFAWRLSLDKARAYLGKAYDALTYEELTPEGKLHRAANPGLHGDVVIARKDSPSAYHIAATYDDALQDMTHIIRGEDLIDAPHIHTLLHVLMGWSQPTYQHHTLILDEDGNKLSKRQQSLTLASLRADGMTADQVRARLGFA